MSQVSIVSLKLKAEIITSCLAILSRLSCELTDENSNSDVIVRVRDAMIRHSGICTIDNGRNGPVHSPVYAAVHAAVHVLQYIF